jgi:hypothetical protein
MTDANNINSIVLNAVDAVLNGTNPDHDASYNNLDLLGLKDFQQNDD